MCPTSCWCLVALAFLAPLVYAVSTSLKPADEVFTPTPHLFGTEIRWQNYADAFTFAPFGRYFLNSLFVAVAGTLVVVVASSHVGVRVRPAAIQGP